MKANVFLTLVEPSGAKWNQLEPQQEPDAYCGVKLLNQGFLRQCGTKWNQVEPHQEPSVLRCETGILVPLPLDLFIIL